MEMGCNKLPACHVSTFTSCVVSDSEDVRRGDERVRPVLAPLPRLLHHHPLPPRHHEGLVTIIIIIIIITVIIIIIRYTQHMYLVFYWFAMANCCINPIVYYAMNKRWVEA